MMNKSIKKNTPLYNKRLTVFAYLFLSTISYVSYSQNYKENLKNDICTCIEEEIPSLYNLDKKFQECYQKHLTTYAELIDSQIEEGTDSEKYRRGQEIRQNLTNSLPIDLIYSCDTFYRLVEKRRNFSIQQLKAQADGSTLEKINQQLALNPNPNAYYQRGALHFALDDLENAEHDLRKAVSFDQGKNAVYMTMLVWILEEKKQYAEAKTILDELSLTHKQKDIAVLRAIIIRKMGGREDTPIIAKQDVPANTREKVNSRTTNRRGYRKNTNKSPSTEKKKQRPRNSETKTLDLFKIKKDG